MRIILGGMTLVVFCLTVDLAIAQKTPQNVLALGGVTAGLTVFTFLFHCLNVRVEKEFVRLRFGIGLVRKKFRLADIEQVTSSRSHWYNGWGVKKVWRGWLYNVSGFGVVELKFKNGKRALIGTDEPEKLTGAIEAALAAN